MTLVNLTMHKAVCINQIELSASADGSFIPIVFVLSNEHKTANDHVAVRARKKRDKQFYLLFN